MPLLLSDGFCELVGMDRVHALEWFRKGQFERLHSDDVGRVARVSVEFANGKPAKPFATYADGTEDTLDKLTNDRFNTSSPARYGYASTLSDFAKKVVWGETFSFTVDVQWLDAEYRKTAMPEGASVTLTLNMPGADSTRGKGSTTRDNAYHTQSDVSSTFTFEGLARYDGDGKPCKYLVSESNITPVDYDQVYFYGDLGVTVDKNNAATVRKTENYEKPLVYSTSSGDSQHVILSNKIKYTEFTVSKTVSGLNEGETLKSTFTLYRIPKYTVQGKSRDRNDNKEDYFGWWFGEGDNQDDHKQWRFDLCQQFGKDRAG